MGLFSSHTVETLEELLVHQLKDLYDAEHRLVDVLPEMAKAASSPELKKAFDENLADTRQQINRLEKVFDLLGVDAERVTCAAMKGLVTEGQDVLDFQGDESVKDAALIASGQRYEHYEIAGYGCTRNFAKKVGRDDVADLLQQTLDEEGAADEALTTVAVNHINPAAATA